MKPTVRLFIVTMLMLMPCIAYAIPGAHGVVACNGCHVSPNNIANNDTRYSRNVCLTCHAVPAKSKKRFLDDDFSNLYNNKGIVPQNTKPMWSSHKWYGSENIPAAGAVAPIDPRGLQGLNKTGFAGSLSCSRCHSVHGTSGVESAKTPFLRMQNDTDQLCRSCHRLRDTKDHKLGTHPVNVSYTSARNANTLAAVATKTSFRTAPVTNAINPTGQVKLIKGDLVVCSTCHGVHYADSNTSTYDSYSAPGTFGPLSSSKGYLLRVSTRGKTTDNFNICTNCHVSKNHNIKVSKTKPSLQCIDCHSGHVEYDPADPGGAKNLSVVRRYLQYTTAGRVSKRILYTTRVYWNGTRTGVCQVCHSPPQNHYAVTSNWPNGTFAPAGSTYADCSDCHNHAEGDGAFSYGTGGSCNTNCHGLPPTSTATPGTGPVADYTSFNEANTPHAAHAAGGANNAFDCIACHEGYTMPRDDADIVKEVFVTKGPFAGPSAYYSGSNCYNVYCHSTGRGTWKSGTNPISWGAAKGVIINSVNRCKTCHDDPNYSVAHTRHVNVTTGMGYGCVTCHASTVANNTTLLTEAKTVSGTHTNKVKDVAYSGLGAAVGADCATVQCHSNGRGAVPNITPTWGSPASGACGACHWARFTSSRLSTGSHSRHFGELTGTTEKLVCIACHVTYNSEIDPTHANGTINTGGTGCAGCHASPYSTVSVTPAWGTSSTGCGQCHSGGGSFTGTDQGPNTGSHNKHMAVDVPVVASCNQCHAGAVAGLSGGLTHANQNVDVTAFNYPAVVPKHTMGSGYRTCTSAGITGCHVNPYSTGAVPTPTWGVSAGCASCHTTGGAFTTAGVPATGGHTLHIAIPGATCASCHLGTISGSNGGSYHIDGDIDATVVGYAVNLTKHTTTSGYRTCSTAGAAGCHVNPYSTGPIVTPTWNVSAGCGSCHTGTGTFTGTGSSPATGSHTKHMAAAVGAACSSCHTGVIAGTTGGPTAIHRDGNIDVIGGYTLNITKHTTPVYVGSCSTSMCHATNTPPVWGVNTAEDFCTKCHGTGYVGTITTANRYLVAPNLAAGTDTGTVSTTNSKTGAHQTHIRYLNGFSSYSTNDYRCEACHGTLPSGTSFTHADSFSTPQGKFQKLATKWGAMTPTYSGTNCTNTYCHNPAAVIGGTLNSANAGTGIIPSWINGAYIADGTKKTASNCNMCHKVPGRTGFSGYAHAGATTDAYVVSTPCQGCHGHNGDSSGTVLGKRHMDGIKAGGGEGCSDCHGYPPMTSVELAARGGGYVDATLTTNSSHHLVHLPSSLVSTDGSAPCVPCHPFAGLHDQGSGTVIRANVQVFDEPANTNYRFDSSRSKRYNATLKTCKNVSCHFQPTTAW